MEMLVGRRFAKALPQHHARAPPRVALVCKATAMMSGASGLSSAKSVDIEGNIVPFNQSAMSHHAQEKLGRYLGRHAIKRLRGLEKPIDKYLYLRDLQLYNPGLYFRLLMEETEEVMPYVYTPTVGEACQRYHELPIPTQGVYLTPKDKGRMLQKLRAACNRDVRVIVVTDGERILGLGDLGANGMGISEGKIQLYTAIGGVNPDQCLPVCIDMGTNNEKLLADPEYKGLRQKRLTGAAFDELMDEFMGALRQWKDHILLQFEDFGNTNAFRLLDNFRNRQCCFNDDIQGTACVSLAGILAALRASGKPLKDQRIVFYGAGEAGTGIGELFAKAVHKKHGIPLEEARKQCFFLDSRGLVCKSRMAELQHHKIPFAHDVEFQPDLLASVKALKPTILIGVSTIAKAFSEEVVREMAALNERPIIFPLSNPTSKSECTYEEAFNWTDGRVVFASGSPFAPLTHNGVEYHPAQANNAYIFPSVGHAAVLTKSTAITDDMFLVAADELSRMSPQAAIQQGFLFPPFHEIAQVSRTLIAKVAEHIVESGMGTRPEGEGAYGWEVFTDDHMWHVGGDMSLDRDYAAEYHAPNGPASDGTMTCLP
eukprot:CAMPEP_0202866184 /NCGR_PEP_ID=MMETSP1391-20130828/7245_1 /ASSEMBLY_ACC=CAM_ASM_000867 /TAXON_ID=1034604 /ORGANISM="Chlamydomonas leiostraca, Strain SAG 11-49" /LENGTH=597 /DNA_ID=CAMNT_0049546107 /DNA_START=115 /DNA_END=1908 /DNA_ORIENTATION=-